MWMGRVKAEKKAVAEKRPQRKPASLAGFISRGREIETIKDFE